MSSASSQTNKEKPGLRNAKVNKDTSVAFGKAYEMHGSTKIGSGVYKQRSKD